MDDVRLVSSSTVTGGVNATAADPLVRTGATCQTEPGTVDP